MQGLYIVVVKCLYLHLETMTPLDIQLLDGTSTRAGRVSVDVSGNGWLLSTIRDVKWGMEDASVACRQLGYTAAIGAPRGSFFGPGKQSFSK